MAKLLEDNDLTVFLIKDYDNDKIYDAVLINKVDFDEVHKVMLACDTSSEENNPFYEEEYHGFYDYLRRRRIWYRKVNIEEYHY